MLQDADGVNPVLCIQHHEETDGTVKPALFRHESGLGRITFLVPNEVIAGSVLFDDLILLRPQKFTNRQVMAVTKHGLNLRLRPIQ